ncbi:MAG: septation protein A [Gammaproteobacteria bacterium]|nr:septation protein A [Gammaproteobacteria bacterium]
MKLLFDFFPIVLFFIAYKSYGIFVATVVAIVTSILQVAIFWLKNRRFEKMHLITLVLITVLGGATLIFQDRAFFMWKPTAVNWLFALAFLGSHFIGKKNMVERMMGHALTAPGMVWRRLNFAWVIFFVVMGIANLYVASLFFDANRQLESVAGGAVDIELCTEAMGGEIHRLCLFTKDREDLWVDFKLFGMLGLTFIFVIGQAFYLARHLPDSDEEERERASQPLPQKE